MLVSRAMPALHDDSIDIRCQVMVVRARGDDEEFRPWHYIHEGRGGRWGTLTMALHIRIQHREYTNTETQEVRLAVLMCRAMLSWQKKSEQRACGANPPHKFRANRQQLTGVETLLPESKGHNLDSNFSYVLGISGESLDTELCSNLVKQLDGDRFGWLYWCVGRCSCRTKRRSSAHGGGSAAEDAHVK